MGQEIIDSLRVMDPEGLGRFAERLWSNVFLSAGLNYIPLHRIQAGGAPLQRGGSGPIILPDFEVSTNRFTVFVDSKAKRHPVYFRQGKEWRHGVNARHWDHYAAISEQHRQHCCLALFEAFQDEHNRVWSGALLVQGLQKLGEPFHGFSTQADMVYWPRRRFEQIGSITPDEARELVHGSDAMPVFREALHELLGLTSSKPVQMRLW
jgi:hypothetical protein